jgi:hypothetical protein
LGCQWSNAFSIDSLGPTQQKPIRKRKILKNSTPQTAGLQPAYSGLTTELIVWSSAKSAQHFAFQVAFEQLWC